MSRIPLLLSVLLPACATEVATSNTQQAATYYEVEGRRCDPNLCILFTALDSDRDGVADDDELAAGTDPNDPVRYPTLIDLATLMAKHELPTFERGNSLMVLLPTRDANGLPLFGGERLMAARKSSLETAGIKAPDGIDLSRGFTIARTVGSNDLSFGQLFTAFGREDKGTMPVRLLADAIGSSPSGDWNIETQTVTNNDKDGNLSGELTGFSDAKGPVEGIFSTNGTTTEYHVHSSDGTFRQSVVITKNADGSVTTKTITTVNLKSHTTTLGGHFTSWKTTMTTSTTSADHRHVEQTTQTTVTHVDSTGQHTETHYPMKRTCDDGLCHSTTEKSHDDADDGSDHGYMNPEAAEHSGVVTATPLGMQTAIVKLQTTVRVVQNDNDPLSNYEVPPTGIHDKYGPIALYGGDPESNSVIGGFGITPAFVRVPQPEYDPNFNEQMPPKNAPPDNTCLYCYQPPVR